MPKILEKEYGDKEENMRKSGGYFNFKKSYTHFQDIMPCITRTKFKLDQVLHYYFLDSEDSRSPQKTN